MLESYSLNAVTSAGSAIPFNNTVIEKGCTVTRSGPASIQLNKRGVYMVSFNAVSSAASTVQLYKNGVAQPQTETSGTNLSFETLVQVSQDNTCNCCTSPTVLQVMTPAASTFSLANINITKIC